MINIVRSEIAPRDSAVHNVDQSSRALPAL